MTVLLDVLMAYTALVAWVFVLAYTFRAPWWKTPIGRNLVAMAGSLAVAFTLLAVSRWAGPWPAWVWVLLVANIAAVLTQRVVIMWRATRRPGAPILRQRVAAWRRARG